MPSRVRVPTDLQYQYYQATSVHERYLFYYEYFNAILPPGLKVVATPDLSDGLRKELRIVEWTSDRVIWSGLIHRSSDTGAEEVAGDEAFTRVGEDESWDVFRFFTAAEAITFFRGDMRTGDWVRQGIFHPINQAGEVQEYFNEKLFGMYEARMLD